MNSNSGPSRDKGMAVDMVVGMVVAAVSPPRVAGSDFDPRSEDPVAVPVPVPFQAVDLVGLVLILILTWVCYPYHPFSFPASSAPFSFSLPATTLGTQQTAASARSHTQNPAPAVHHPTPTAMAEEAGMVKEKMTMAPTCLLTQMPKQIPTWRLTAL